MSGAVALSAGSPTPSGALEGSDDPWIVDLDQPVDQIYAEHGFVGEVASGSSVVAVCAALTPVDAGSIVSGWTFEEYRLAPIDVTVPQKPSTELEAPACQLRGTYVITFAHGEEQRIVATERGKRRPALDRVAIPAGRYAVSLQAWDDHLDSWRREGDRWIPISPAEQAGEGFRIVGESNGQPVFESPVTVDLQDSVIWIKQGHIEPPIPGNSAGAPVDAADALELDESGESDESGVSGESDPASTDDGPGVAIITVPDGPAQAFPHSTDAVEAGVAEIEDRIAEVEGDAAETVDQDDVAADLAPAPAGVADGPTVGSDVDDELTDPSEPDAVNTDPDAESPESAGPAPVPSTVTTTASPPADKAPVRTSIVVKPAVPEPGRTTDSSRVPFDSDLVALPVDRGREARAGDATRDSSVASRLRDSGTAIGYPEALAIGLAGGLGLVGAAWTSAWLLGWRRQD